MVTQNLSQTKIFNQKSQMDQIKKLQEKIGAKIDGDFGAETLKKAAAYYKLTHEQTAHLFGQIAHETGDFKYFTENLNYSATQLLKVFKRYFKTEIEAKQYANKAIMIANKVYANRMGNGDEKTGDGYKFCGRGSLQLTGRQNYLLFSKYINNQEIMNKPELVATEYAFESAIFFFIQNNLFKYCQVVDDESITKLSKAINVGNANSTVIPHGLDDRITKTKLFYKMLIE